MAEIIKPLNQNLLWASSGVIVAPDNSKYSQGWVIEQPAYQYFNYIINKVDVTLASINQHGYPTWDSETEYQANNAYILKSGVVYYCKTTHTNQDPTTDVSETYWRPILTGQKPFLASSVNNYILPFLGSGDSTNALSNIGVTTIGRNIIQATTQTNSQIALGGSTLGRALFTTSSAASARSSLEIPSASESVEGLVQRSSDLDAIAGTNDTKFLTPKKLRLGFSISLGINGHIIFPSWLGGYSRRWGYVTIGGNSLITLNSLFNNTCLNATASLAVGAANDQRPPHISPTGVGVRIYNPDSTSVNVYWSAEGY